MNTTLRTTAAISLAASLCALACGGGPKGPAVYGTGETGVTSAQRADSAVVAKLATARCDREEACSNVGGGQKYASRNACMDQMRGNLANDLNSYNCPRGIDEAGLDRCMNAIRSEACSHPLDTISRLDRCRTDALCMK